MSEQIEQQYLKQLLDEKIQVSLYLINGIKLIGQVASFDNLVIVLKDGKNTTEQLIYKHAISTIVPAKQ